MLKIFFLSLLLVAYSTLLFLLLNFKTLSFGKATSGSLVAAACARCGLIILSSLSLSLMWKI